MSARPEFFKLDPIDRKVLFWLMDNVQEKSLKSWMYYIADDYRRNKDIELDAEKLYREVREGEGG